jgi:hypothetical protein
MTNWLLPVGLVVQPASNSAATNKGKILVGIIDRKILKNQSLALKWAFYRIWERRVEIVGAKPDL